METQSIFQHSDLQKVAFFLPSEEQGSQTQIKPTQIVSFKAVKKPEKYAVSLHQAMKSKEVNKRSSCLLHCQGCEVEGVIES